MLHASSELCCLLSKIALSVVVVNATGHCYQNGERGFQGTELSTNHLLVTDRYQGVHGSHPLPFLK